MTLTTFNPRIVEADAHDEVPPPSGDHQVYVQSGLANGVYLGLRTSVGTALEMHLDSNMVDALLEALTRRCTRE
jgi:hypothetical protein